MKGYLVVDTATGKIVREVVASTLEDLAANVDLACEVVKPAEDGVDYRTHVFDFVAGAFVELAASDGEHWARVRADRDALLAATDWTQLPDVPASTRARYVDYRQALRDLTTAATPGSVRWPELPTGD